MSDLIISPVGRFINGSMTDTVKTDYQNRPIPEEKQQYTVGVAFRKDDPLTGPMLQQMATVAMTDFANAPHIQQLIGQYNFAPQSGFSWKVKDGDQPNSQGQLNENAAGCYVIYFSSSFITKCADPANAEIPNTQIERGHYIRVAFNVSGNKNVDSTAGIYVNPQIYQFIAFGEPIRGGVDAATAFAGHAVPTQLPAGASPTPLAGGQMAVPAGVQQSPALGQPNTVQGSPMAQPTMQPNTGLTTGYPTDPNAGQMQQAVPGAPMAGQMQQAVPGAPMAGQPGVAPHATFANGPQGQIPATGAPMAGQPGGIPGAPVQ